MKLENNKPSHTITLPIPNEQLFRLLPLVVLLTVFALGDILQSDFRSTVFLFSGAGLGVLIFGLFIISRDKIVITENSIILKRQYSLRTRTIFHSQLSEFKDIVAVSFKQPTLSLFSSGWIVFRNDEQTKITHANSIRKTEEATRKIKSIILSESNF